MRVKLEFHCYMCRIFVMCNVSKSFKNFNKYHLVNILILKKIYFHEDIFS